MGDTWVRDQIEKRLRKRSEQLAKGTRIEDLDHELTIEGIAEHYQKSTSEIADMIVPKRPYEPY